MTGPEHWCEADQILLGDSDPCSYGCPHSGCPHEMAMIARAQVHATLALAAATALRGTGGRGLPPVDFAEWARAAAVQPARSYYDQEPEPEDCDAGPEADDEGGMSKYRGWLP
jgi:hypothetical protein